MAALLALLGMGLLGWFHGRSMYEVGVQAGRIAERRERLEREDVEQRRHLRLVR